MIETKFHGDDRPSDARHPVRRSRIEANGGSFHVLEQGDGPAVVFAHGFPDTAETWRSPMRAVAEAGYRAVALDMRGFTSTFRNWSDVSGPALIRWRPVTCR